MAFKMKGSPIKLGSIATKSALKQKTDWGYTDSEYKDKILEKTGGSEDISDVNLAEKKIQRKKMKNRVRNLTVGTGLNKALREEKKLQNERLRNTNTLKTVSPGEKKHGYKSDKDRKNYRKYTLNEDGSKSWGPEIKTPKWWSSGKKKRDYIKTMQGRQIGSNLTAEAQVRKPSANEGVPFGYFDENGEVKE